MVDLRSEVSKHQLRTTLTDRHHEAIMKGVGETEDITLPTANGCSARIPQKLSKGQNGIRRTESKIIKMTLQK